MRKQEQTDRSGMTVTNVQHMGRILLFEFEWPLELVFFYYLDLHGMAPRLLFVTRLEPCQSTVLK